MTAFIGIGSNLGDRLAFCREAVSRLGVIPTVRINKVSSLYETEPVDFIEQPCFYNAVIEVETTLSPHRLLLLCQEIERGLGKKIEIPKGPRTIDLDLLLYDRSVVDEPGLILPHPSLPDRPFVLIPLTEIAPDVVHPVLGETAEGLRQRIKSTSAKAASDPAGVKKIAEPGWERTP